MLLTVYISMSSIGPVHVQVHWNTFWFILHVMFGDKISGDKEKKCYQKCQKRESCVL